MEEEMVNCRNPRLGPGFLSQKPWSNLKKPVELRGGHGD
jgi:hypothetical protein